jgi:hypothetical protein
MGIAIAEALFLTTNEKHSSKQLTTPSQPPGRKLSNWLDVSCGFRSWRAKCRWPNAPARARFIPENSSMGQKQLLLVREDLRLHEAGPFGY